VAQTQDEGFHEIQLNGKQLVFLFMAVTAVSVVIFLCGVLFGRGVRAERNLAEGSATTAADVTPQQAPAPAPPPASADPTKAAAPSTEPDEKLTYWDRLDRSKGTAEPVKGSSDKSTKAQPPARAEKPTPPVAALARPATAPPAPATLATPATQATQATRATRATTTPAAPLATATPAPGPAPAAEAAPSTESAASAGQGFAVQIAALNVRSEADAIAKRLTSKGYSAYVVTPANGTPTVFRVRVGKFSTRREAETVAAKLQKEEQFKPWVTR
jgi:cell division protein FtsN